MKIHNVLILFTGLFLAIFLIYSWAHKTNVDFAEENREYAVWMSSACYDAAKTIDTENMNIAEGVWSTEQSRTDTLDVYYKTLANNISTEQNMNVVIGNTPFVILVDNNGFYISYNAGYDDYGNSVVPDNIDTINTVSGLNTYTGQVNGNTIRYYLNDYVGVTLQNGSYYDGIRWEVYEKLPSSVKADLAFLIDDALYAEERAHAVVLRVEEVINYYLNTQKNITSAYNTGYGVTLPEISGEDWSRMLKHPSIISFAQGRQLNLNNHMLNVYAFSAGELTDSYSYFVANGLYYRYDSDTIITKQTEGDHETYLYMGIPVEGFFKSMEEAAKTGAMPSEQIYH